MDLADAETCYRDALRWEIPLSQMVSVTPQMYIVSVLRFLPMYRGNLDQFI
jgi:hypothetical protein